MEKRFLLAMLVLVLGFVFHGCDLDNEENFHFISLEVVEADVPESFTLNGTHDIEVTYRRMDNCTFFQGFNVDVREGTGIRDIVAVGAVMTEEDCQDVDDTLTATLTVTTIFNGTYTLRFYSGRDAEDNPQFIEYEVPVVTDQTNK